LESRLRPSTPTPYRANNWATHDSQQASQEPDAGDRDDYENTKRQHHGSHKDAKDQFATWEQKPRYSRQSNRRAEGFTKQTHAQSPFGNLKLIH
jgi:hypothetical protein